MVETSGPRLERILIAPSRGAAMQERNRVWAEPGRGLAHMFTMMNAARHKVGIQGIGVAERALEAMAERVLSRVAFGKPIAEQGTIREGIANSRLEIEQSRLLTLMTADRMDKLGNKAARTEISMIKVVAPNMALTVIDRAMQAHGAAGVSPDFGLAAAWAHARTLRFADGPDEVHRRVIARLELRKYQG